MPVDTHIHDDLHMGEVLRNSDLENCSENENENENPMIISEMETTNPA